MYEEDHVARLEGMVRASLVQWALPTDTEVKLLTFSENATFLLTEPTGAMRRVVRVHRPGYHSAAEIESELAWIGALRRGSVLKTPAPLQGADGKLLQLLDHGRMQRHAVLFEHVQGREPGTGESLVGWFAELGSITARMHGHARAWRRPAWFVRKVWDYDAALGAHAYWGPWRAGLGLDAAGRALIGKVCARLREGLAQYGTAPDRFGVIHADLRLANLIVTERGLHVIDFDDCGLSWFVYDFAAAVSFIEHLPILPELLHAWLEGYRRVAPVSIEDAAAIPMMIILRRLLLLAWIASHSETPTARAFGQGFTEETLRLCEAYLSGVIVEGY